MREKRAKVGNVKSGSSVCLGSLIKGAWNDALEPTPNTELCNVDYEPLVPVWPTTRVRAHLQTTDTSNRRWRVRREHNEQQCGCSDSWEQVHGYAAAPR